MGAGGRITKTRINPASRYFFDTEGFLEIEGARFEANLRSGPPRSTIFAIEGNQVLSSSLYGCELATRGAACAFCASSTFSGPKFSVEEFSAELAKLKDEGVPIGDLVLGAGSVISRPDRGYGFMAQYIRAARSAGVERVNIELMPAASAAERERVIGCMAADGVTSVQYNMEIWGEPQRRKLMPFKGTIPREAYLESIRLAAERLGPGKASSVLLVGLDSYENLLEGALSVIANNGIPSIELFRPLAGTPLERTGNEVDLEKTIALIGEVSAAIILRFGPEAQEGYEGCLKCGGCSLMR